MKKEKDHCDEKQTAMRVSRISILVNILLSLLKLAAGILGHSGAMISDAVHSASDVFSTVVVMIGVTLAGKKADKQHPYGHERMECVAAILLAAVLFITGGAIGMNSLKHIFNRESVKLAVPGALALAAALLSIAVKEWMYWYTILAARRISSPALKADAWHHRSDALSSVGALLGIAGARAGYPVLDSVAGLVICAFIVKAGIDVFADAVNRMIDCSCDEYTMEQMRDVVQRQEGVRGLTALRTRLFGARIYVDVRIMADGNINLVQAGGIAKKVHDAIEEEFPGVKHCMVYVDPDITDSHKNLSL